MWLGMSYTGKPWTMLCCAATTVLWGSSWPSAGTTSPSVSSIRNTTNSSRYRPHSFRLTKGPARTTIREAIPTGCLASNACQTSRMCSCPVAGTRRSGIGTSGKKNLSEASTDRTFQEILLTTNQDRFLLVATATKRSFSSGASKTQV